MSEPQSYILRIQREELERQLFGRRIFFINISRNWSHGMVILFVKKDVFAGSGVIDRFTAIDYLEQPEKDVCFKNNWYGKIVFSRLTRFVPAIPVHDTSAARQNPIALHGTNLTIQEAIKIQNFASCRIIL